MHVRGIVRATTTLPEQKYITLLHWCVISLVMCEMRITLVYFKCGEQRWWWEIYCGMVIGMSDWKQAKIAFLRTSRVMDGSKVSTSSLKNLMIRMDRPQTKHQVHSSTIHLRFSILSTTQPWFSSNVKSPIHLQILVWDTVVMMSHIPSLPRRIRTAGLAINP